MLLTLEVLWPDADQLGSAARHTFDLTGGIIGRHPTNSWVLSHVFVEADHALITFRDGAFFIEAITRNGLQVNARRLAQGESHRLRSGDRLIIGPYDIAVSVAGDQARRHRFEDYGAAGSGRGPAQGDDATDFGAAVPRDYDPTTSHEPEPTPAAPKPPHPVATPSPGMTLPSPVIKFDPITNIEEPHAPRSFPQTESEVEFSAYFPSVLPVASWRSIAVYVHLPTARSQVDMDNEQFVDGEARADVSRARTQCGIQPGAEIQIVPSLPGCVFNPARAAILWLEDWHRVIFRVRPVMMTKSPQVGVIQFYVGPVLVGEVTLWPALTDAATAKREPPAMRSRGSAYQAVFVSYCHQDATIVDQLEQAYSVLGMSYIRDVHALRSGEAWNDAILAKIPAADVFQLCWSTNAKASRFVEQEWRRALQLRRPNFIRPVYWEVPMPAPPTDLADLHFARLHWLQHVA